MFGSNKQRILVYSLCSVLCLFLNASTSAAQNKLANFGLKDQNDKYVEVNFPSDRPVILIFGDRKGSEQIDGWVKPLYQKYQGKVYIFGVASLSGVPSYARGLVRRLIKRQTSVPVLLDWGGKVSKSVAYEKDKALILVLNPDGSVVARDIGTADGPKLSKIFFQLDKAL